MRRLSAAVLAAAILPATAAADPLTIGVHSVSDGGSASLAPPGSSGTISLGSVTLPTAEAAVILSITGLAANTNFLMELFVFGAASSWNTLRAEVLDPLDHDDYADVHPYHAGVPAGYSTSNKYDGFSFAQSSNLERTATWSGGVGQVVPDENTHGGDILLFTGLYGSTGPVRLTFGLRDYDGNRNFLLRLSAEDGAAVTPEPASMLLLGTGLAGLLAARRRYRRAEP